MEIKNKIKTRGELYLMEYKVKHKKWDRRFVFHRDGLLRIFFGVLL